MSKWILAVDFGTTTTSAAMGGAERAEVVEIDGSARMPSVVMASESGDLIVGAAAESQVALSPERAERTPKRRLGDEMMLLGERPVRPVEAVAAIIRAISAEAIRRQGGEPPSELRLTHPARWGSVRRQKLAEAAALVGGLPEPVFVPEPVAAAVHFADGRIEEGAFVAVYDLGGGTFDTAVLRRIADGFEVVGIPGGDERLGGEAFDERLFHHVGDRIAQDHPEAWEQLRFSTDRSWRKAGHDLRLEVRRAKEALSANSEYTVYVGAPVDVTVMVTRDELEALIHSDVTATIDELEATVRRAGIGLDELAAVNLAGGSSRIPMITRLVAERFGRLPQTWGDPKAAVALGAVKATRLTSVASSGTGSTVPAASSAPLPERAGGYEVLAELGRGGMGVVYLARQPSIGRLVAVKSLPVVDPNLTDRLRREATVLAELQHPNIATVIDVATDERGTHVVMPFFPGGTASHALERNGRFRPGEAATVLASVAEALAATHDKGFLHRDVKPSNVLLSQAGDAYLADFGLALPMLDSSRLTNSRSVLGTAPYTAPEILSDESPTPAADTYSLGVTGFQLLTGRLPYAGSNVLAVLDAVRRGTPAQIAELAPDVPPVLAELVTQAFAADPADRPTDLRAWAADVRNAVEVASVQPAPPVAWASAASAATATAGVDGAAEEPATAAVAAIEPPVPHDVEELIGFRAAPTSGGSELIEPLATEGAAPNGRARMLLIGTAAVLLLIIGVVAVLTGGDDDAPRKIETAAADEGDTPASTTSTTEKATTTTAAPSVDVPSMMGQTQQNASALLTALGFKVNVVPTEHDAPAGTVVDMDPRPGAKVAKGGTVAIVVAKGPTTSPGSGNGGGGGGSGGGGGGSGGGSEPAPTPQPAPQQPAPQQPQPGPAPAPAPANRAPVPSHGRSNPDSYSFCSQSGLCNLGWYQTWMQPSAFADPEGDSWYIDAAYDAEAAYGYVTVDKSGSCTSRAGGACLRYAPTTANATKPCYEDWVVFTAKDSKGARSEKYWLKVRINC